METLDFAADLINGVRIVLVIGFAAPFVSMFVAALVGLLAKGR